jgi:hypothetical protein
LRKLKILTQKVVKGQGGLCSYASPFSSWYAKNTKSDIVVGCWLLAEHIAHSRLNDDVSIGNVFSFVREFV